MNANPLPSGDGPIPAPADVPAVVPFPPPARMEDLFRVDYARRVDCPIGNRFAAVEIATGAPVDLLFVRPEHAARPQVATYLRQVVETLRRAEVPPSLVRLDSIHLFGEDLVVVGQPLGRSTLEDLVGQCGSLLTFEEALSFLAPIATAVDFLRERRIFPVPLRLNEIAVLPVGWTPSDPAPPPPLAAGQSLVVQIDPVRHPPGTIRTRHGYAPEASATVSATVSGADRTPVPGDPAIDFAALIYRLVVGREVPETVYLTPSAFTPTQRLGDQSNSFLREILGRLVNPVPSCRRMLAEICRYEGLDLPDGLATSLAPAPSDESSPPSGPAGAHVPAPPRTVIAPLRPAPPPLPAVPAVPAHPARPGRARWIAIAAAGLLVAAGMFVWLVSRGHQRGPQVADPQALVAWQPPPEAAGDPPSAATTPARANGQDPAAAATPAPQPAGRSDAPAAASEPAAATREVRQTRSVLDTPRTTDARAPIPAGLYQGAYWYADRARLANKNMAEVGFNLVVQPDPKNPDRFTGKCDEQYSDFGTVENGRVRSRIVNGVCERTAKGIRIRFIKRYSGYPPQPVYYEGTYDPVKKQVRGTWHGEAGLGPGGGFVFTAVPQQPSSKPRP